MTECFKISPGTAVYILIPLIFISCNKKPSFPVLTTENVTDITQTSVIAGGNITDDGGSLIIARGVCWNMSGHPTVKGTRTSEGGGKGIFKSTISGLTSDTYYYLRAYATNEYGTGYGNLITFTTLPAFVASLTTRDVVSITATGAVAGGDIIGDGGGKITTKGVCWAKTENPTTDDYFSDDGIGTEGYNSYLTGLEANTNYYVRAYATNSAGTAYGNQVNFTTDEYQSYPVLFNSGLNYGSVSDVDGNVYKTIQTGNQIWMAENLRTTRLNDGSVIANIVSDEAWSIVVTEAYCWYNNDISNKDIYGALYNWYTASSGKLCPGGWHIPDHTEWLEMIEYIGGLSVAGGLMKETGTTHWLFPNTGATNESGFTALPAGIRTVSGYFENIGSTCRWWKSTEGTVIEISYNSAEVTPDACCVYRRGLSVRCLKDK